MKRIKVRRYGVANEVLSRTITLWLCLRAVRGETIQGSDKRSASQLPRKTSPLDPSPAVARPGQLGSIYCNK